MQYLHAAHLPGAALYHELSREEGISRHTYRDAGVDIDAGHALVEAIKPMAMSTARAGLVSGLGGFAAAFDPRAAGFRDPILVAATDGVGTKLKIASAMGRHDTVGVDLVAMCVNDLVVEGAEPLFFLDYFATGRLQGTVAEAVLAGIADGCRRAGCALIGGETAEMPGMYAGGDYDLAGFAVGAAERGRLLTGATVAADDVLLGLASSGLHSNGFSLVRRIVADGPFDLHGMAPFDPSRRLGDVFLEPTRIYVKGCLAAIATDCIKALAHITGGGLIDNLPRVLPDGLGAELDPDRWPLPPVFRWLAHAGGVCPDEMARTFNCGLGMIAVVAAQRETEAIAILEAAGETVYRVGRLVAQPRDGSRVELKGIGAAWPS